MYDVNIYTDGSCLGNPGPGGWCAILEMADASRRKELAGGYRLTTNNRMEIMGALTALAALKKPCAVELFTDSQYLGNALAKGWLFNWRKNNWLKKNKTPIPNADLWRQMSELLKIHSVHVTWVRGHAGHPQNERCDAVARQWAAQPHLPPDMAYEEQNARG